MMTPTPGPFNSFKSNQWWLLWCLQCLTIITWFDSKVYCNLSYQTFFCQLLVIGQLKMCAFIIIVVSQSWDQLPSLLKNESICLTRFLVRTVGRAWETINMDKVREDIQEQGFGDNNKKEDKILDHNYAMIEALEEQQEIAAGRGGRDIWIQWLQCNTTPERSNRTGVETSWGTNKLVGTC